MVLLSSIQESIQIEKIIPTLDTDIEILKQKGFLTYDNKLTSLAIGTISEVDKFFKLSKKSKKKIFDTPDFLERLEEYRSIFPKGSLPSGKVARTSISELQKKMTDFFITHPDYDWDLVLDATSFYVDKYQKTGYLYMQTAGYFISKLNKGSQESQLADYCEMILEGEDLNTVSKSQYNY